ncbi:MAG: sigma-54 dependent transcriptional regulator [Spirochaetales bacterium]|nr:sigma-54 dependent transcriptional regulator [Spirochaetales bacterium]
MKILIVDDEPNIRKTLSAILQLEGFEVRAVENAIAAQRVLEEELFDVVISDLRMPGMDGFELLEWIGNRERERRCAVIMISAFGEIMDAVEAMKLGARDYIAKPFKPDELVRKLRRLQIEGPWYGPSPEGLLIGNSSLMIEVKERIGKIARSRSTVLITGESGTGKEVAARSIHQVSGDSSAPFVALNIGGVPENLLESELFGHEKGAFTGADSMKKGLFEMAQGGTLFLDEIGEMPIALQVKLLRVLQERKIRRLGSTTEFPIDVRIIAATNKELENASREGAFREDLYYRLNVARIHLPPLRERRDDIPLLVRFFMERLNQQQSIPIESLSSEAADALYSHRFPGNVRELENILERAFIFAEDGQIRVADLELPGHGTSPTISDSSAGSLKQMERQLISQALARWEGNRTKASQELGISRRTIINKIAEYNLE